MLGRYPSNLFVSIFTNHSLQPCIGVCWNVLLGSWWASVPERSRTTDVEGRVWQCVWMMAGLSSPTWLVGCSIVMIMNYNSSSGVKEDPQLVNETWGKDSIITSRKKHLTIQILSKSGHPSNLCTWARSLLTPLSHRTKVYFQSSIYQSWFFVTKPI